MAMTAALSARLTQRLPDAPGFAVLRRATRAAIVIPMAFALEMLIIGDVQVATFLVFGCFALLVLADFGGLRRPRAGAYIITTLIGAALVILGTLVSPIAWVAALVMLLVGFSIQFSGIFGSYVAAAQTALLLSFVLAVSVPASPGAIGPRLEGWLIAGLLATLSGVFFWPRFERLHLRRRAAEACRSLARWLGAEYQTQESNERDQYRDAARAAVEAVRSEYTSTPKRPAGPARRDRAFVELLTDLERTLDFATRSLRPELSLDRPCIGEANKLADTVVRTLEKSADVLTGGPAPDLLALNAVRLAHREAIDSWAAEALRTGTAPEDVLEGMNADHPLRVISYLVFAIGTNAVIAAGAQVGDAVPLPAGTPREGRARPLIRIARTIRTYLTPSSVVLQQSLRVGIGLALAVLLARLLQLQHAFWVVLGTLTVLRSNAFGTGRSTVEALAGTVAGFVVGAFFTIVVGATSPVLWAALPVAVFLATYAASAISFVVGQAAFTIMVIILFNLISPVGWTVGLARIEDVAVGVGVSVVVGLLLWPRGARGELLTSLAGLYRAVTGFLADSFDRVLDPCSSEHAAVGRGPVVRARDRAGEAFGEYLAERGTKSVDPKTAAFLVAAGTFAITGGDLLNVIADLGFQVRDGADGMTALRGQTQIVLASFLRLADRLDDTRSALLGGAGVSDGALRDAALASLRRWRDNPEEGQSAVAVIVAAEWVQQLGELATDLEATVDRAVEEARVPWWR